MKMKSHRTLVSQQKKLFRSRSRVNIAESQHSQESLKEDFLSALQSLILSKKRRTFTFTPQKRTSCEQQIYPLLLKVVKKIDQLQKKLTQNLPRQPKENRKLTIQTKTKIRESLHPKKGRVNE